MLNLGTVALLTIAPLLWAANAVVGRIAHELISPFALNLGRWVLAFLFLAPLAWRILRRNSPLWEHWRAYMVLGLLGIGCYNSLLYLALKTSSPLNATLVNSSMPIWMLAVGRVIWGIKITGRQMVGALLSIAGVALVLSRGQMSVLLSLELVPGDLFMLLATLLWSLYTWLLTRAPGASELRGDWAAFLFAQLFFGVLWSFVFTGAEIGLGAFHVQMSAKLAAILVFVALGPALLAYRCWGAGVQRSNPTVAGFFANLLPLFTAVLSVLILGQVPQIYHGGAFLLIVGGIWVASRR